MADERRLYAAQLCYDQLGKRIRVTSISGQPTEEKLQAVYHNAFEITLILGPIFGTSTGLPDHIQIVVDPKSIATVLD